MEKVSLREYAKREKLSYFTVMKLVRNGELESETVYENGKDVPYIVIEDKVEKKPNEKMEKNKTPKMSLEEENLFLKKEIIELREALERCNKRTVLA